MPETTSRCSGVTGGRTHTHAKTSRDCPLSASKSLSHGAETTHSPEEHKLIHNGVLVNQQSVETFQPSSLLVSTTLRYTMLYQITRTTTSSRRGGRRSNSTDQLVAFPAPAEGTVAQI